MSLFNLSSEINFLIILLTDSSGILRKLMVSKIANLNGIDYISQKYIDI